MSPEQPIRMEFEVTETVFGDEVMQAIRELFQVKIWQNIVVWPGNQNFPLGEPEVPAQMMRSLSGAEQGDTITIEIPGNVGVDQAAVRKRLAGALTAYGKECQEFRKYLRGEEEVPRWLRPTQNTQPSAQ